MNDFIQNKVMPPMMKFLNTRAISAIKNGMIYPIPFIIIGSVFLILANLPIPALATAINNSGWARSWDKSTTRLLALWPFLQYLEFHILMLEMQVLKVFQQG